MFFSSLSLYKEKAKFYIYFYTNMKYKKKKRVCMGQQPRLRERRVMIRAVLEHLALSCADILGDMCDHLELARRRRCRRRCRRRRWPRH